VHALLAGIAPQLQGGVLADLLAIHIAGHIVRDNPAETNALRDRLLNMHIAVVRQLIPVHAAYIQKTSFRLCATSDMVSSPNGICVLSI
jgi:hypothetical protein